MNGRIVSVAEALSLRFFGLQAGCLRHWAWSDAVACSPEAA